MSLLIIHDRSLHAVLNSGARCRGYQYTHSLCNGFVVISVSQMTVPKHPQEKNFIDGFNDILPGQKRRSTKVTVITIHT